MPFCGSCGTSISGTTPFCTSCGSPVGTDNPAKPRVAAEQVLLDESGVLVSNSRYISDGQTYAMRNVTSVKMGEEPPSRQGPLIAMAIGAVIAIIGFNSNDGVIPAIIGLGIFLLGLLVLLKSKSTYFVVLHSASGEQKTKGIKDRAQIEKIVAALNHSIVLRG
ncbi:MAG: DUF6232 family protein [Terracidiphilus sp.]